MFQVALKKGTLKHFEKVISIFFLHVVTGIKLTYFNIE
jgi:hypothetical protein